MSRDDDRTWAELVDAFHASPDSDDATRRWPAAEDLSPDDDRSDGYDDASVTLGSLTTDSHPMGPVSPDPVPEAPQEQADDHFVPPPPAPIPRGDRVSRLAWAGVIFGPVSLVSVTALPWTPPEEFLLFAVTAFIVGFVTLIARMRGHHPDDPDNGAVL